MVSTYYVDSLKLREIEILILAGWRLLVADLKQTDVDSVIVQNIDL